MYGESRMKNVFNTINIWFKVNDFLYVSLDMVDAITYETIRKLYVRKSVPRKN